LKGIQSSDLLVLSRSRWKAKYIVCALPIFGRIVQTPEKDLPCSLEDRRCGYARALDCIMHAPPACRKVASHAASGVRYRLATNSSGGAGNVSPIADRGTRDPNHEQGKRSFPASYIPQIVQRFKTVELSTLETKTFTFLDPFLKWLLEADNLASPGKLRRNRRHKLKDRRLLPTALRLPFRLFHCPKVEAQFVTSARNLMSMRLLGLEA
jgi:hypothetical protein